MDAMIQIDMGNSHNLFIIFSIFSFVVTKASKFKKLLTTVPAFDNKLKDVQTVTKQSQIFKNLCLIILQRSILIKVYLQ